MRFYWSLFKSKVTRSKDAIARFIVWRLLPARIIMWAYYRVAAHATTGEYENTIVPELDMMTAIDRYARDKNLFD